MKKPSLIISPFGSLLSLILIICLCNFNVVISSALKFKDASDKGFLVTKDQRKTSTVTEYGQISAVQINDGFNGSYHLQFITLEPNSLFLPVLLHADMVFYVHTGSGSMTWVDEEKKNEINVNRGDIHRFPSGSVFYIKSRLESTREKLRIYAIFTDSNTAYSQNLFIGPYSTLSDLVLGFDKKVLQSAFQVPREVLDEITGATKPPAIVHMTSKGKSSADHPDWRAGIIETIIRGGFSSDELNGKKKKTKTSNILDKEPDFSNCNGWSVAVNNKDFRALKDSDIGVFMVNLTKGAMMGPHWNPRASEIAVVTHGEGMISVVCPRTLNETQCKNMRFKVKEGDVFTVPRFYPMAQMAYNNDSLVFMGFSTNARKNHPQFLAGESSVFRTLDKDILAMSFNVPNTTMDHLLDSQVESIILECVSCAEEEEERLREEIEKKKQEEEAKKREEEEARRREEEKSREREREEEEARRREEERRKQQEARRREEAAKREEEEERQARERQEEVARKEEKEAKREEEERKAKERQARERQEEQERQKEEARRSREEEEKAQTREEARREDEEAQRTEEEREESRREEEEREEARRAEDERQIREREEEVRRQEEKGGGDRHGGGEARRVLTKMWKI